MSHTPLPWSRINCNGFDNTNTTSEIFADFDREGMTPTRLVVARTYGWIGIGEGIKERRLKEASANADLIIKCVNSHDYLVNALKFYALFDNWKEHETGIGMAPSNAETDSGYLAALALAKIN